MRKWELLINKFSESLPREFKSVVQTKHIYKLIQIDSSGTNYTITVNSFKTNQPISQNLFIFDEEKYINQGYYINKLE